MWPLDYAVKNVGCKPFKTQQAVRDSFCVYVYVCMYEVTITECVRYLSRESEAQHPFLLLPPSMLISQVVLLHVLPSPLSFLSPFLSGFWPASTFLFCLRKCHSKAVSIQNYYPRSSQWRPRMPRHLIWRERVWRYLFVPYTSVNRFFFKLSLGFGISSIFPFTWHTFVSKKQKDIIWNPCLIYQSVSPHSPWIFWKE